MNEKLLLHCCCAPCASAALPSLVAEGYDVTLYFYGANIHPLEEWKRRRDALLTLAGAYNLYAIVRPYDTDQWFSVARGLEALPEGGERCRRCMALQLQSAAAAAYQVGAAVLCSSLTTSPQKRPHEINAAGQEAAQSRGLRWESRIWRKKGGFLFSIEESRRLGLYRQNYCGCLYSRRDASQKATTILQKPEG